MQAHQRQLPAPEPTEKEILLQRIEDLETELAQVRSDYEADRAKRIELLHKSPEVRRLYAMLCLLFDGKDRFASAPENVPQPQPDGPNQPPDRSAWQAWKNQLPPASAKIIDALLIQPLTQTQMRAYCKLGPSSISAALTILRNNSLVEQDGSKWKLKRL